ncbi:MAG: TonB-dependent receptor domain-containing protein [Sphingomonadaceae bacterium]
MSLATAAHAQASDPPESEVEEVVVTGSRITRKDYSAESPIVTVSETALKAQGPATLEATLNQLPQFAATAGSSSTSQARGSRANANLRGLGIARTLVLLDGRRLQPSDPLGAIDLNTISPALVESVEVITGGASAVYGSDAIAGVLNFKLKRRFEGLELDAQYGQTSREDGQSIDLSATFGGEFADGRGNAAMSISYMNRDTVKRGTREFFQDGGITAVLPSGMLYPDASNLPTQAAINSVFAAYGAPGQVLRNAAFSLNPDGTLFTIQSPIVNFRWPYSEPYVISNGNVGNPLGEYYPLQQPLERYTVFGRASYELNENVEAYAQFNYTHYVADQNGLGRNQAITRDVYLPVTNPFLNADVRAIMASRPNPTAPILFYFNTGRYSPDISQDTYNVAQITGGLRGAISAIDGDWDVYASYGSTEQSSYKSGYIDRAAFLSLINAPDGGRSICEGGLNPLILDPPSQACLTYLLRDLHETTELTQTIVEGSVQGRLFTLPAGEVRFAGGFGYRENAYDFSPDAARLTGSVLTVGLSNPTNGSTDVKEVFGEVLVPLASDLPFVRSLNANLAYRYSDYQSIGGVQTYKASGDWEVVEGLRLRGGYQRAIRAPSVGELFQPSEQSSTAVGRTAVGGGDPCDVTSVYRTGPSAAQVRALCLATGVPASVIDIHRFSGTNVASQVSGNPDLKEETADTYTLGLVWRPGFDTPLLSKLSVSVDYYDIKIRDAIGLITGAVLVQRCFNGQGDSNPTYDPKNYYCGLIGRGPSGGFATLSTPLLNLAGYRTSGVDLQVDWSVSAGDVGLDDRWGALSVNAVVSYMDRYSIQTLQGAPFVNYAGTIGNTQIGDAISHPEWKSVANFTYSVGNADLSLRWRWIDAMENSANVGAVTQTALGVTDRHYFDLTGRYRINETTEVRAGMLNLADEMPPVWTGEGATDPAIYDVLGRRFYVGLNLRF